MKPHTPLRREATAPGGNGLPTRPRAAPLPSHLPANLPAHRPAHVPARPVLLRQHSPQQLALDLRRR